VWDVDWANYSNSFFFPLSGIFFIFGLYFLLVIYLAIFFFMFGKKESISPTPTSPPKFTFPHRRQKDSVDEMCPSKRDPRGGRGGKPSSERIRSRLTCHSLTIHGASLECLRPDEIEAVRPDIIWYTDT
jgi:hypothetical protein